MWWTGFKNQEDYDSGATGYPWWYPVPSTDESEHKYQIQDTWDHLGDAHEAYEKLADDYLALVETVRGATGDLEEIHTQYKSIRAEVSRIKRMYTSVDKEE